jgi:hypothetical protein
MTWRGEAEGVREVDLTGSRNSLAPTSVIQCRSDTLRRTVSKVRRLTTDFGCLRRYWAWPGFLSEVPDFHAGERFLGISFPAKGGTAGAASSAFVPDYDLTEHGAEATLA